MGNACGRSQRGQSGETQGPWAGAISGSLFRTAFPGARGVKGTRGEADAKDTHHPECHLDRLDDALTTTVAVLVRKEADATDNEVRGRIKAIIMALTRKVVEDPADEAHKWLKKSENPKMIHAENIGDKVLSTPDELLAGRAQQWKKLWTKGANKECAAADQTDGDQGGCRANAYHA